jgi:glycosyltransferase involved in cell wall biosynthesis
MDERIRIAFVIDQIQSPTAGTEKQLCTIISHLDRQRFEPCLCVLKETEWSLTAFGGGTHVVGIDSYLSPGAWGRLWGFASFLRRGRFRIVHTFHRDGEIVGTLAARLAGVPRIIGSRRDQGYWLTPRERAIRSALRHLHHGFVTNAHSTRDWLVREESIPAGRIEVIPNGVDLAQFTRAGERSAVRDELGLAPTDLALACVATLRPVKRHEDVLAALAAALARDPRWKLVLVGDGECRAPLMRQAGELGIAERVLFLGTRLDIPRLLAGMDVGVLFSASESMSNTLLEYMAAGLPVVSSDVGEARYLVADSVNGYVVPAGDVAGLAAALGALVAPEDRAGLGASSRERSLAYDAGACTRRFEEYYRRCLG